MTIAPTPQPDTAAGGAAHGFLAREVVRIYKAFVGRGPTRAVVERVAPDRLECLLGDVLTPTERILVDSGRGDLVTEVRHEVHPAMVQALTKAAEDATGCRVTAAELRFDPAADAAAECFILGPRADVSCPRD